MGIELTVILRHPGRTETEEASDNHDAYIYRDAVGRLIWQTSVPKTRDEAVEYIDWVEELFGSKVEYIQGRRPRTGTPTTPQAWESIEWSVYDDDSDDWKPFVTTVAAEEQARESRPLD